MLLLCSIKDLLFIYSLVLRGFSLKCIINHCLCFKKPKIKKYSLVVQDKRYSGLTLERALKIIDLLIMNIVFSEQYLLRWSMRIYFTFSDITPWKSLTNRLPSVLMNLSPPQSTLLVLRIGQLASRLSWSELCCRI